MKQLTWKLVLPITIITFSIFTKWWYVLPVDAGDTIMHGFPLIWVCEGWHTSMSLQIFVTELIIDFFVYFLFWFSIVFVIKRFVINMKIPKIITIIFFVITGLICLGGLLIGSMSEHIYKTNRDFDIKILTTGYTFIWQDQERPEYEDYK